MTHGDEFRAYMKAANRTSGSNDDRHLTEAQVIAYCRGEMPAAEREAAEAHLVECEQCLVLFRNARDFVEPERDDEPKITDAETDNAWRSFWPEVQGDSSKRSSETATVVAGDFRRSRDKKLLSGATLALAASLLISIGALVWQTVRLLNERRSRQQSQEIAMVLEGKQRELEQRLSQIEHNGRNQLQQERDQRLAAEAERDQLEERLAQQGALEVPVYTVRLASERGSEDNLRVRFSGAAKAVRLKLLISKPYEFPQYAAELSDQSGTIVLQASGLRPGGDDGALSWRVNTAALNTGTYQLRLFGGKDRKQLGEYAISVTVSR